MKKGFTLMEILFVLLVIALVISFAVPAIRSVRYDIYNSRAKAALKKLAEARRSYYQYTKGSDVSGGFLGSVAEDYASETCLNIAASGIPGNRVPSDVSQLFACNFLDWKDFDVPYSFILCGTTTHPIGSKPCVALGDNPSNIVYVGAMGDGTNAGSKYSSSSGYFMSVGQDRQVLDNLE